MFLLNNRLYRTPCRTREFPHSLRSNTSITRSVCTYLPFATSISLQQLEVLNKKRLQCVICMVAPVSNDHSSVYVRTDLQMSWLILCLRRSLVVVTYTCSPIEEFIVFTWFMSCERYIHAILFSITWVMQVLRRTWHHMSQFQVIRLDTQVSW
jgi:hypothetical protein